MIITEISKNDVILLDSDALFAIGVEKDANHKKAFVIFQELVKKGASLHCLNIVKQEATTVYSYKKGQDVARGFLERFEQLNIVTINLDRELEEKAWDIFKNQRGKGTSFVDCANLAVYEHKKMNGIFSFDKFYDEVIRLVV